MLNLLQTTLLYIEEQTEWLSELQTILIKKERKYKVLHSMITKEILDELEGKNSSDSDVQEIKKTLPVVEIKTEGHDNKNLQNNETHQLSPGTSEMLTQYTGIASCISTTAMNNPDHDSWQDQFENNVIGEIAEGSNYDQVQVVAKAEPEHSPEDMENTNVESNMETTTDTLTPESSTCNKNNSAINAIGLLQPELNTEIVYINGKTIASQADPPILALKPFSDEKPHKCLYCDLSFRLIGTRLKHERIHTGEKPYKCPYCDKHFRESGTRKRHIRLHTGEKPYKCNYCEKAFAQSGNRTLHMRIHTGEKPFECSYCEKAFRQPRALKYHIMRIHVDKTRSDQTMQTDT